MPGYEVGRGRRGVVLVHEAHSNLCGWWPYAVRLAHQGFHVILFDDRCQGEAPCSGGAGPSAETLDVAGAVSTLRRAGARQVALIGASHGGSIVITAAAAPLRGVRAVVSLSADELYAAVSTSPPRNAHDAAPIVRVPVFAAVARHDKYVGVATTRALIASMPTQTHLVVSRAAGVHGWGLLLSRTAEWSHLARDVEAFLRRAL